MNILDCTTEATTYESLASLLDVPRNRLKSILLSYGRLPAGLAQPASSSSLLLHVLSQTTGTTPHIDHTSWFHLTRAVNPQNFTTTGIQPLGERVNELWALLGSLSEGLGIAPEDWEAFIRVFRGDHSGNMTNSRGVHHAKLYALKVRGTKLWGPYALLIRETAFASDDLGNHNYLAAPEIVEDICIAFNEWGRGDLLRAFMAATHPCIVKFIDDKLEPEALSAALDFLYARLHGQTLTANCNVCFDASGVAIPRERICNVEVISGISS